MSIILYRPVKGERGKDWRLTQRYGNNFKVGGRRMYGDIVKGWDKHLGIDRAGPKPGQKIPCYSSIEGLVSKTGYDKGRGNYVYVQFDTYEIIYAHLDSITCKLGPIKALEQVGVIGTTGNSTGVHLHYGLRPIGGNRIDPTPYISDRQSKQMTDNMKKLFELNSTVRNETDDTKLQTLVNNVNNHFRSEYK